MNYVYDILLNFQKEFYDFYEWNSTDEITHIKKIPLIKISSEDLKVLKYSLVKIDGGFLHKISNKTEKFSKAKSMTINYAFLISNGKETVALKLNKNGVNTYKSSLLLDEEDEISDIALDLDAASIKYHIIKQSKEDMFKTRNEKENQKYILQKLNKLYDNKEMEKLKFLYLDCFNKEEKNIEKIFSCLKKETLNNQKSCEKMNSFFKIIEEQR